MTLTCVKTSLPQSDKSDSETAAIPAAPAPAPLPCAASVAGYAARPVRRLWRGADVCGARDDELCAGRAGSGRPGGRGQRSGRGHRRGRALGLMARLHGPSAPANQPPGAHCSVLLPAITRGWGGLLPKGTGRCATRWRPELEARSIGQLLLRQPRNWPGSKRT